MLKPTPEATSAAVAGLMETLGAGIASSRLAVPSQRHACESLATMQETTVRGLAGFIRDSFHIDEQS